MLAWHLQDTDREHRASCTCTHPLPHAAGSSSSASRIAATAVQQKRYQKFITLLLHQIRPQALQVRVGLLRHAQIGWLRLNTSMQVTDLPDTVCCRTNTCSVLTISQHPMPETAATRHMSMRKALVSAAATRGCTQQHNGDARVAGADAPAACLHKACFMCRSNIRICLLVALY